MKQEMQKIEERMVINGVVVFGANLIHPKILEVLDFALKSMPENNLQAIFITPERIPTGSVAEHIRSIRSMAISLPDIVEDAILGDSENDLGLSLTARAWIGIIYCIWHELHHNVAIAIARQENLGKEWEAEEEVLADEFAQEKVEETIIMCEAEVPKLEDFPWVGTQLKSWLEDECQEEWSRKWAQNARKRIEDGIVFESSDDIFDSLVSYFRAATSEPEKYERENKGAPLEMTNENIPGFFDSKILPGKQRELFPKNLETCVSSPVHEGEGAETTTLAQKGESMKEDIFFEDDMPLPEEAYGYDGDGSVSEENPFGEEVSAATPAPKTNRLPSMPTVGTPTPAAAMQPVVTGALSVLRGIYMKCHEKMFSGDVYEPIALTETEKTLGLIKGCRTMGSDGNLFWADTDKFGAIAGCKYKNGTLPAYELLINWNGSAMKIKLIAQNPNKNSEYAARARAGERITWIIDGNTGKFKGVIINGKYFVIDATGKHVEVAV